MYAIVRFDRSRLRTTYFLLLDTISRALLRWTVTVAARRITRRNDRS